MREGLQKIVPTDDTIAAVSTPLGRSALGVVRISGPKVRAVARQLFQSASPLIHRQAVRGLWLDLDGQVLDEVLATLFESPSSYTGEDTLEISGHGNPLVLGQILAAICACGVRPATAGEFTLRAVLHGKLDLVQAEAVRDFIDAQTEVQARLALRQIGGALSRRIQPIQDRLVELIARLEAGIDFAEDDVAFLDGNAIIAESGAIRADLAALQKTYGYGKLVGMGIRLAIVGKPNVGKSSLFNRLVSSDRAIVTEIPGTTRDILTETISFHGIPLRLFDTAGLRETDDVVERLGMSRSLEAMHDADLVLVVVDGAVPLDDEDLRVLERVQGIAHRVVINKSDLVPAFQPDMWPSGQWVRANTRTADGLAALWQVLHAFLEQQSAGLADSVLTTARQNSAVSQAVAALEVVERSSARVPHEMLLLDLYQALSAMNELTGEVVADDILGKIFSTFCVGK